jgi:hypothetical protein
MAPEKLSAAERETAAKQSAAAELVAGPAELLQTLRNEYLEAALYSEATAKLEDLKNGMTWPWGRWRFSMPRRLKREAYGCAWSARSARCLREYSQADAKEMRCDLCCGAACNSPAERFV